MARCAILGLALLLAMIGDSSGQSPPEPPRQNPGGTQERTNTEQRDTDQAPPSIIKKLPAEDTQPKPSAGEQKRPENQRDAWALSDKIAVIASIAALLQFFALVGTVLVLIWTARRQLRAYVFPNDAKVVNFDTDSPIVQIIFKNAGQTPAFKMDIYVTIAAAIYPLTVEPTPPSDLIPPSKGAIGPGMDFHIFGPPEPALTPTERSAIKEGTAALYAIGKLTYRDAFGIQRFTKFSFVYGGEGCHPEGTMGAYKYWDDAT